MSKTILIVDDEKDIRTSLSGILEDEGFRVASAGSGVEALECIRQDIPDLVLLDIWMPGLDGLETLEKLKSQFPHLIVIMISGHGTIETAVRATKLGAFDFIEKPLSLDKVLITIGNALEMQELRAENEELKRVTYDYKLVGESKGIVELREQIMRMAPTATPVLICGENGCGKELVARSLHNHSNRHAKPFITVNCAAIPEELLGHELFGYEKGAFTGALSQKKGKCDLADGGTLFLDGIGDLSLPTQDKLLRLIEEHSFERLGGSRSLSVDIRIFAATNRSLDDDVQAGRFRKELLYLLNVVPFHVPPLREHKDDIPVLVPYFVNQYYVREGSRPKTFLPEALELLSCYDWPGNVSELRNTIERIVIMTPSKVISAHDLASIFEERNRRDGGDPQSDSSAPGTLREAREEFERDFIIQKLEENDWNISRTAEIIELERSNLHRKIKSYRIDVKK